MKRRVTMDLWAGLVFIAFGLFFMFYSQRYEMGDAMHMGSGYFPAVLGGLMALLGGVLLLLSFVAGGGKVPAISFRPLFFITLSLLAFGYLLDRIGMVFSLALTIVLSELAGYEFRVKEIVVLTAAMAVLSVLVFVHGLGLPLPLWPRFMY